MLPIYNYLLMDLYNASKISIHQIQIQFLNINQEFSKFFTDCLSYVCRTCLTKHLPYVFRNVCSAICHQCKWFFTVFKVSFLSSKCLSWFFSRSTDFPGRSFLFTGLESNGLRPDPLAGPRSCQRAPRWIQRCTRLWRLTCHFGKRTWVNSCFSSCRWRCPDWLYWWANRFDVDWLDETSVSSITMCFVVVFDPIVSVCLAETRDLPSEGPLLRDRVLKSDSLARSE